MEKAPAASAPPAEDDKLIEIQHAEPVEAAEPLALLERLRRDGCVQEVTLPSGWRGACRSRPVAARAACSASWSTGAGAFAFLAFRANA